MGLLFLTPFVLIGLGMLVAPVYAWRQARNTVHAVTDKRLVTLTEGRARKVVSILPTHIISLERSERRDGSGTLKIVTGYRKDSDGDVVKHTEEIGHVAQVRAAERLLLDMRESKAA